MGCLWCSDWEQALCWVEQGCFPVVLSATSGVLLGILPREREFLLEFLPMSVSSCWNSLP